MSKNVEYVEHDVENDDEKYNRLCHKQASRNPLSKADAEFMKNMQKKIKNRQYKKDVLSELDRMNSHAKIGVENCKKKISMLDTYEDEDNEQSNARDFRRYSIMKARFKFMSKICTEIIAFITPDSFEPDSFEKEISQTPEKYADNLIRKEFKLRGFTFNQIEKFFL
jgi:hypothetical protein